MTGWWSFNRLLELEFQSSHSIKSKYCLGCKDYSDNFKLQEVKMTNKVLREKSNCVVCWLANQNF